MPTLSQRSLKPGAAPARVLKYFKRHPKARPVEITLALGIKRPTVEMAISRLVQLGLHVRPLRAPREVKPMQSAASPTESLRLARAQFSAAAAIGPALTMTSSRAVVHPTGTPIQSAGAVQVFGVSGPQYSGAPGQSWNFSSCAPLKVR